MKSSSLGVRLFEGLVQPIFGAFWNGPPATIEKTGEIQKIDSSRQARVRRPVSSAQPASGYADISAMRGYARLEGKLACDNGVSWVAVSEKESAQQHPELVPPRPAGSGNTLVHANDADVTHQTSSGSPQGAQGRSRRKPMRILQRQIFCRPRESAQGITKDGNQTCVTTAGHARGVIRHRTKAVLEASTCTLKSRRARQHKEDKGIKSTSTQASVLPREKSQCTSGERHPSSVEREDSHRSKPNAKFPQPAAEAHVNSHKGGTTLLRSTGNDDGFNSIRSGPGGICLGERSGFQNCGKCNSDCSSSSIWGSDDCLFAGANSSHSLSKRSGPTDNHQNVQAWLSTDTQCKDQPIKTEQYNQCLTQQAQQAYPDSRAIDCAMSVEEVSCQTRLRTWQCVAHYKHVVPKKTSYPGGAEATPCGLQCSDTTTTCSSSSMTSCGDARDTATASAPTMSEHAHHYVDVDEQMPVAFPSTTTEEPSGTLCQEGGVTSPPALHDSQHVTVKFTSSFSAPIGSSSFSGVHPGAHTSSTPHSSLAFASSRSTTAASTQTENRILMDTSSHPSSVVVHAHQEEAAAETQCGNTSTRNQGSYMPGCSSGEHKELDPRRNTVITVASLSNRPSVNLRVTGHQDNDATSTSASESSAADAPLCSSQQELQQSCPPEGSAVGSVIFGHRVLKPLRSKSLEENYDALVEIVAFTKRRCEKETMELLRKDLHILYYARGLHHAAHVETYMQQQQDQKSKPRQRKKPLMASGNDSTDVPSKALCGRASTASGNAPCGACQKLQRTSVIRASKGATNPPSNENKTPAAPFPSVSAALASGARPHSVPDWATPEALRNAMERQQCYDPFSIFGEAPPELLLSEVYDEQHYTYISPQTRASHPVLARLRHQRRAALMAVFKQKCAALTRTLQLLEHELGKMQRQQRYSIQQLTPQEHDPPSSIGGRVLASYGSGMHPVTLGKGVAFEADTSRKGCENASFGQVKSIDDEDNGESKSVSHRETILRLKHRGVLSQHSLLEKRLELQLQQEEMIHSEMLRNGFHFFDIRASGGVCGAVIFRKRVLPALESWWQQQCQVELDWRNDPLTSEECSWYREVMNAAVDASDLISIQQACFCPTPPPYRPWAWTDCRVRQRKQHEQKLAKQRQEQLLQAEDRAGEHRVIEWEDAESNAAWGVAENQTTCQADRCSVSAKASGAVTTEIAEHPSTEDTTGTHIRGSNAKEIVDSTRCDEESDTASEDGERLGQVAEVSSPARRGRKRRVKESECTPRVLPETNVDIQNSEKLTAPTSSSGSARKRPRSFCRHARKVQCYRAQVERSQNLQCVNERCSSRGCKCKIRHHKKDTQKTCCPSLVAQTTTHLSEPVSAAAVAAGQNAHELIVQPAGGVTNTLWAQAPGILNEERGSEFHSRGTTASMRPCNVTSKENVKSRLTSPSTRPGGHVFSTPVAKMQALKLSKQQRILPTAPLQHAQQRVDASGRGAYQQLHGFVLAPSTSIERLHGVTSPHKAQFASPTPATTAPHAAGNFYTRRRAGNGRPDAAVCSDWGVGTEPAEAVSAAAVAGGSGCCGGGAGAAEYCSTAAREISEGFSSTAVDSRPGRKVKHQKLNTSQGLPRHFQNHGKCPAENSQAGRPATCNRRPTGHSILSAGRHSLLAKFSVPVVSEGTPAPAKPANIGLTEENINNRDISTGTALYPRKSNVRLATLPTPRCGGLSIDRVYGCRRTSGFFHDKHRSQFGPGSLFRPAIASATYSASECDLCEDVVSRKDTTCINHEVL